MEIKRLKTLGLVSIGMSLATSLPAHAQFNGFGDSEGLTVGVAAIANWSPYEGTDSPEINPVPYIAYDWENMHVGVDGINYSFWNSDALQVTALLEPRWTFGDPEDSPLFEDIERDTAFEAGLEAVLDIGPIYVSGTALQDISDVHNGFEGSAEVGVNAEFGSLEMSVGLGYAYRDKDLSAHLYGVRLEEARADLSAYAPDTDWYPYIDLDAFYALSDSMGILAFARYEHLGSNATDSPLVSRDRDANIGLALLKRF